MFLLIKSIWKLYLTLFLISIRQLKYVICQYFLQVWSTYADNMFDQHLYRWKNSTFNRILSGTTYSSVSIRHFKLTERFFDPTKLKLYKLGKHYLNFSLIFSRKKRSYMSFVKKPVRCRCIYIYEYKNTRAWLCFVCIYIM